MDDNIYMEPSLACSTSSRNTEDAAQVDNGLLSDHDGVKSWCPSYILDFSDLSIGRYFSLPTYFMNFHATLIILVFIKECFMMWHHILSSDTEK